MATGQIVLIVGACIASIVFFSIVATQSNKLENDSGRILGMIGSFFGVTIIGFCILMGYFYLKGEYAWKKEYDNLKKLSNQEYRLLSTDSIYVKIK